MVKKQLSDQDLTVLALIEEASRQYDAYVQLTACSLPERIDPTDEVWAHDPTAPLSLTLGEPSGS